MTQPPTIPPSTDLPPASLALTALGIPHTVFRHTGPVNSLEQAAAERGQQPEQVIRSILFRLGRKKAGEGAGGDNDTVGNDTAGNYAMVLMAGPGQIAWKALRQHFGQSRLTMATPDEVLAVTGYVVGAVTPFGMPAPVPVLVDESVTAQTEISLGSGLRGTTIILTVADLLAALGGEVLGGEVLGEVTTGKFGKVGR